MITIQSVVSATPAHSSSALGDELVLLDFESSEYYGLDPVGAHVWRAIQSPTSVENVCDAVAERFEVDRSRCERDVVAFLRELAGEGLVAEQRDAST